MSTAVAAQIDHRKRTVIVAIYHMRKEKSAMGNNKGTKRPNGDGYIGQRADGRWVATITLPNGRPKSFYGKTQAEAPEKKRNALRDQDNGIDLSQKKVRVGEFLDRWLEDVARPKVRPKTYRFYEQVVRVHLKPGLDRHDLAKLTPVHVQRFLNEKRAAGLSPQTCGHLRAVLRTALNHAVRWYLVPRNAAALASPPRIERVPVQPLTAAQARAFLAQAEDDRLVGLFRLAILTGMRQGELFGLRWTDVDLDASVLHVRHALHRSEGE